MLRKLLPLILIFSLNLSRAQTFDCYIANDTIISPTIYKFDVYLEATSNDFYFRSIQLGFSFNCQFIPSGAAIQGLVVQNSTELRSYVVGTIMWNSNYCYMSIPSSAPQACVGDPDSVTHKLIEVGKPVRVTTIMLVSDIPFQCTYPNMSITRPIDNVPGLGILKTALSEWNTSCTTTTISLNGTYTSIGGGTLLNTVNNPLDTLCNVGVDEIVSTFKIFPNPTRNKFKIKSANYIQESIRIYDYSGKLVKELKNPDHSNEMTIDISAFQDGVYEVRIGNDESRMIIKE